MTMLAVQGYYDGVSIRPLNEFFAKPNQKVIITVMDEFVEPKQKKGMRGVLAKYADSAKQEKEKNA